MSAPIRCTLILTLAMLTLALPGADAFARPPSAQPRPPAPAQVEQVTSDPASSGSASSGAAKRSGPPLVGRVRTRHGTVDLTRETLAAGGPAHDLAEATARVIADAEVSRTSDRRPEPFPLRDHRSQR